MLNDLVGITTASPLGSSLDLIPGWVGEVLQVRTMLSSGLYTSITY